MVLSKDFMSLVPSDGVPSKWQKMILHEDFSPLVPSHKVPSKRKKTVSYLTAVTIVSFGSRPFYNLSAKTLGFLSVLPHT